MASAATGDTLRQIDRIFGVGTVSGRSDPELLERFTASRDEEAFAALVERHGPMVRATCRAVLKDEHAAEDAFQATFLTLARKAPSLWTRETLSGWLYRVAYRNAVRAAAGAKRRHGREREAMALAAARTQGGTSPCGADWLPVLHEEIDRLPERERASIVLCYLQELSYEQAARALRWTVPALRCRLAKARERLRGRLSRRRMGTTGAGAALTTWLDARPASAGVPHALAKAAVRAAMEGTPASLQAVALTARMSMVLSWTRLRDAVTGALTLSAVISIVVFALNQGRPDPDRPAMNPQADPRRSAEPEPQPQNVADDQREFHGLVLDPQGRPFTGAALVLADHGGGVVLNGGIVSPRAVRARSGGDGRFRFTAARSEFAASHRDDAWRRVPVVASAPGYGPDWATLEQVQPGAELTLRLVTDDVPIAGRVLHLQGRPIARAAVHVELIKAPVGGDLSPFLDAWKRGDGNALDTLDKTLFDAPAAGLPVALQTGADGRFHLSGIGRERTVRLRIEAQDVEQTIVSVLTRAAVDRKALATVGPETEMRNGKAIRPGPPLYAPVCDLLINPGRSVTGNIREQGTGKPLAGVEIRGSGEGEGHSQSVTAVSDDQGRYRLSGLPVAARAQLSTFHQGHLPALAYAPADEGLAPANVDFDLARGVIVRGKVTEQTTAKPVFGIIIYQPLVGNTFYHDNPAGAWFKHVINGDPIQQDGTYEVLVGPGPGAILVQAQDRPRRTGGPTPRYLPARRHPDDGAPGSRDQEDLLIGLDGNAIFLPLYQTFGIIDPKSGGEPVTCNLQVVLARTRPGKVVGPDGRPMAGASLAGLLGLYDEPRTQVDSDFTAEALDPSRPHYLLARHDGRKLAGACIASGEEIEPITLKLEPWSTVAGRLLDVDGLPLAGVQVHVRYHAGKGTFMINNSGQLHGRGITSGRDGRFRVEGLVPGLSASLSFVKSGDPLSAGKRPEALILQPGEISDLGDLSVRSSSER